MLDSCNGDSVYKKNRASKVLLVGKEKKKISRWVKIYIYIKCIREKKIKKKSDKLDENKQKKVNRVNIEAWVRPQSGKNKTHRQRKKKIRKVLRLLPYN